MPVPSSITDLSTTASSNSPSGSESPITADDYLRTISAFVATLRDGKGQSAEATVASASTADIGAASSPFVQITGTTTITSFGATYSGARYVRFAAALTLTHNATTLILPGAANITTAAGDMLVAVPTGNPGSGWRVVVYQRADGSLLIGSYVAKTGDTMSGTLTLPTLKASSSAGLIFENASGTQVADFGPGPGTGVTFSGQVNALSFSGSGASLTGVTSQSVSITSTSTGSTSTASISNMYGTLSPSDGSTILTSGVSATGAASTITVFEIEANACYASSQESGIVVFLVATINSVAQVIGAAVHYIEMADKYTTTRVGAYIGLGVGETVSNIQLKIARRAAGTTYINSDSAGTFLNGASGAALSNLRVTKTAIKY